MYHRARFQQNRAVSGHVTTSDQSTASYTAVDFVIAMKSCYQKAKENARNILIPNLGGVHHLWFDWKCILWFVGLRNPQCITGPNFNTVGCKIELLMISLIFPASYLGANLLIVYRTPRNVHMYDVLSSNYSLLRLWMFYISSMLHSSETRVRQRRLALKIKAKFRTFLPP